MSHGQKLCGHLTIAFAVVIQNVFSWDGVRPLYMPLEFLHIKPCFYGPFCAQRQSHAGTGKGLHQTVGTAQKNVTVLCMMLH